MRGETSMNNKREVNYDDDASKINSARIMAAALFLPLGMFQQELLDSPTRIHEQRCNNCSNQKIWIDSLQIQLPPFQHQSMPCMHYKTMLYFSWFRKNLRAYKHWIHCRNLEHSRPLPFFQASNMHVSRCMNVQRVQQHLHPSRGWNKNMIRYTNLEHVPL